MPWIVGGSLISGALGADAAGDAADAAEDASRRSLALQDAQNTQTRSDTALSRSVGQGAMYQLAGTFGIGVPDQAKLIQLERARADAVERMAQIEQGIGVPRPQDLEKYGYESLDDWKRAQNERINSYDRKIQSMSRTSRTGGTPGLYDNMEMDPGYEFRLAEGEKALQRQQSAGGTRYGGAALKAAARYGQDYSSNEFSNAVNRRNSELGYLFSLAGFGQQGIQTAGQAGASSAANSGNILMQNAQMQGNAAMTGASAINNAIQGGIQNYHTQSLLRDYNRPTQAPMSNSNSGSWA